MIIEHKDKRKICNKNKLTYNEQIDMHGSNILYAEKNKDIICDNEDYTELYSKFADIYVDNIKYIDFNTFYYAINKISDTLYFKLIMSKKIDIILFSISNSGSISKSNFWVLNILLLIFSNYLNDEDDDLKEQFLSKSYICDKISEEDIKNVKNVFYILIDDMPYSGIQIANSINDISTYINDYNIKCILATPYISEYAYDSFSMQYKFLSIVKYEKIPSFNTIIKEQNIEENIKDKLLLLCSRNNNNRGYPPGYYGMEYGDIAFECIGNLPLIYFDHKLADGMSIMNKILRTGAYPSTDCISLPFINNCNIIDANLKNSCYSIKGINVNNKCPPSYYKNIKFTFNDTILTKDGFFDNKCILDEIQKTLGAFAKKIKKKSKKPKKSKKSKKSKKYIIKKIYLNN
jgi:hypothetical protein